VQGKDNSVLGGSLQRSRSLNNSNNKWFGRKGKWNKSEPHRLEKKILKIWLGQTVPVIPAKREKEEGQGVYQG